MLRAVMDTNVLYSALRSRLGASFAVLLALRHDRWRAVLSNHLLHEYEEILKAHAADLVSRSRRSMLCWMRFAHARKNGNSRPDGSQSCVIPMTNRSFSSLTIPLRAASLPITSAI